jgi:hypothetical protein
MEEEEEEEEEESGASKLYSGITHLCRCQPAAT